MSEQGFTNAAIDSAHAFRAIMQAMSRPGVPVALEPALHAPYPFGRTAAAVALTLCDFQTPLWLSPALHTGPVMQYLRFHTGAPVTEHLAQAQFAFVDVEDGSPPFDLIATGSHDYPDRSATLVLQVPAFRRGDAVLAGPGIKGSVAFGAEGLGQEFWAAMAENHARFPIGADVIFVGPRSIAAVPRSTAVMIEETA